MELWFTLNSDPNIWTLQQKSRLITDGIFLVFYCPILRSPYKLYPQFPIICWQEHHPVCTSTAVAHLLHVHSLLCALVIWVTVAFLSSWTSQACLLWPLASTCHFFPHTQTCRCGYLPFSRLFFENPRDSCLWKSISSFWNTQTNPSGTNTHGTLKVT